MMGRVLSIVTIVILSVALALFVQADTPGQTDVGQTGQFSGGPGTAVTAQGGNVTEVNVSADTSTSRWQGFYGNVSASLALGDGSTVFFNWSNAGVQAIFASPDNSVDWLSITSRSLDAEKEAKDTLFSFDSQDADSINQTIQGSGCSAGSYLSGAGGVTPYNSSGLPGLWETCLGDDGATLADTVLGTNVIAAGGDAFNGQEVQYQLMVPVPTTNTNYYLYLEI